MRTRVLTALLLLVGIIGAAAQNTARQPSFVRVYGSEYARVDMVIPDSIFYEDSERAIFIVNKWDLDMQSPLVQRVENEVLPVAKREGWVLVGLTVRGAASPEGPLRWNITLSHNRAKALTDYLRARFHIYSMPDSLLTVNTTAEDYPYLHRMMREANDPDADRVGMTVLMAKGDIRKMKRDLMAMDGGRLWKRLLREYFPQLRAARVILFFRRQDPLLQEVPMEPPTAQVAVPLPVEPLPIEPYRPREHMLAVRTNLLYDFMYWPDYGFAPSPDIQLEFYPRRGHFTYTAGLVTPYWHRWNRHKFWQIRHYTLGARYYFTPENGTRLRRLPASHRTHCGWFVGADVMNSIYGIGFSKKRGWEGEGLGAEVTGGYVLPLCSTNRWRLEFTLGVGLWYTRYDPYVYGNPKTGEEDGDYYYDYTGKANEFNKRNHQMWWFGPTQVGIHLTYDLMFWKNK